MIKLFLLVVTLSSSLLFSGSLLAQVAMGAEVDQEVIKQISGLIRWDGVIYSILLILVIMVALRFVHGFIDGLSEKFAQRRLLLQKFETFIQFVSYILGAIIVFFLSFRVNDQILALIGGTIAVAIGFAVKDLVASFIAGIIIMLDRPFQVGDRVRFGGEYGDITAIGLRSVRMQTLTDDTVTIPNNLFLSELTVSGNYGELDMQINLPFYIGSDQDIVLAKNIVTEAAASSRYIHLPKKIGVLVNQVVQGNYFTVKLTLKAYVLDTQYEKSFETDVTLRVMQAFEEHNILPPAVLHRGRDS